MREIPTHTLADFIPNISTTINSKEDREPSATNDTNSLNPKEETICEKTCKEEINKIETSKKAEAATIPAMTIAQGSPR